MRSSFLIVTLFLFGSCADYKKTPISDNTFSTNQHSNLKVGGLYFLKNKDSTYYVSKILVLDELAVHLRTYRDTFMRKPSDINSENLKILIGHAPLDRNGFLLDKPELIKLEEVKDSELEGYKMYLGVMEK